MIIDLSPKGAAMYDTNMAGKPSDRRDTSLGASVDLSPEVLAARVERLAIVRRTAKAALRQREIISQKHGRAKS